jgi:hypothetical protein
VGLGLDQTVRAFREPPARTDFGVPGPKRII